MDPLAGASLALPPFVASAGGVGWPDGSAAASGSGLERGTSSSIDGCWTQTGPELNQACLGGGRL